MKRQSYIFILWIATCMVMISTIMIHHHHEGRICFVEEKCAEDGRVNDEHTGHQENEQDGCSLHQMQQFIINAKVVHSIEKHIIDGGNLPSAILPQVCSLSPACSIIIAHWQETVCPLSAKTFTANHRRGPPTLSLI